MVPIRNFENPEDGFGKVSADVFARIMARVSDMALVLDGADGKVRDVAFGSGHLADAGLGKLIGQPLIGLVTSESREKVEALLAGGSLDGRWRHVNFPVHGGDDVPVSLQVFGLSGGRMLAVGRDERQAAVVQRRFIEAQRELEQNHARLRQADLRFQTMLALSDLAVLTLDADTLKVLDVNRVAADRLGERAASGGDLVGQPFRALLARDDVDAAERTLGRVRETGRIDAFEAALRGGARQRFQVAMFRYEHAARLLVRLLDGDEPTGDDVTGALFARLPHAIAVTDAALRIVHVNRAFVDLAELSVEDNAIGQPLDRFLGRHGVDTDVLVAALRDQPLVRDFATVLVGAFGASGAVDVDAVRFGDEDKGSERRRYGFMIRAGGDAARRARPLAAADRIGLAERMTDVVGRVSLKEIVRDTTDVIERLCIETALGMTENNRAAASEMLGISRQSLYAKLARYGIGEEPPGATA